MSKHYSLRAHGIFGRAAAIIFSIVIIFVSALAFAPAQTVSAASCRHYTTSTPVTQIAPSGHDMGTWYYGVTTRVPSYSSCRDINLPRNKIRPLYSNASSACALFRVRFYPSSGGSYTNHPKYACTGYGSIELATWVKNGTKYRIEASNNIVFNIYD